jgi:pathogenesis-related protein 1
VPLTATAGTSPVLGTGGTAASSAAAGRAAVAGIGGPATAGSGPTGTVVPPNPGNSGVAGVNGGARAGSPGPTGAAGLTALPGGAAGMFAIAGSGATGAATGGAAGGGAAASGETGRMVGMTEAHNKARRAVMTMPALADLTWSPTVAAYAQEWADNLAKTACDAPRHRTGQELSAKKYGENLAVFGATGGKGSTAEQAANGWSAEVACWTYGTIGGTEKCDMKCYTDMHSDGCGHFTQVVWRKTTEVGCGVATCKSGNFNNDIWICNYSPAGNYVGQAPY